MHQTLRQNAQLIIAALMLLIGLAAPFIGLYPIFMMKALCFALLASAFNLLFGYGGLLSFGHASFFGTAAYVTGYTMKYWGISPEIGILLGTLAAAALGVVFGWLSIRRQGIYFAMVTLALAQMLYFFYLQADGFTGGEDGIQAIPRGHLFGLINLDQPLAMYYTVLAICGGGFALIYRVVHSPFGQVLKAIRENEPRAISLGYRVERIKLLVFVLSAALAGLAGATKTLVFQLATLNDVNWSVSGDVILMTLVGGVGTLFGPIVGAFVLVIITTYLAGFGSWVTMIEGTIFIICVMSFRRGLCGWLADRFQTASPVLSESEPLVATDAAKAGFRRTLSTPSIPLKDASLHE
ncbi:branched-chain amino acid ABC transporter permease [Glaciimonas sp. PAMC28666]|uniref:branched-chain amino acid ABC transporter permease n=1 Tax=Glaciimonas sp. PAMC28666 TaxID=2807626 RepID=UPI001963CD15|nr:branched-chain amino acid ABC transporter permease [Glaciimonas sp. PAMC28666]QRX84949.1 branched-chain amino acid ABC transporter permease [Glaciimonas sp. PAMC28666]